MFMVKDMTIFSARAKVILDDLGFYLSILLRE